jgi:hypothetical protein
LVLISTDRVVVGLARSVAAAVAFVEGLIEVPVDLLLAALLVLGSVLWAALPEPVQLLVLLVGPLDPP